MERPVLLVIDMLNDFLDRCEAARREALLYATNQLIGIMRNASHPVIWIRQEFEPDPRDAFVLTNQQIEFAMQARA